MCTYAYLSEQEQRGWPCTLDSCRTCAEPKQRTAQPTDEVVMRKKIIRCCHAKQLISSQKPTNGTNLYIEPRTDSPVVLGAAVAVVVVVVVVAGVVVEVSQKAGRSLSLCFVISSAPA